MQNFLIAFEQSFTSIFSIFLIGILGFYILKKGILGEQCLNTLSDLVINVTVPCLIFHTIINNLNPGHFISLWIFPFVSFVLCAVAFLISFIYSTVDKSLTNNRGVFRALITFQNSLFLPLPIIILFFEGERETEMLLYLFLFGFMSGLLTYIFSPLIMSTGKKEHIPVSKLILNPLTITTFLSIIAVFFHAKKYIPDFIGYPIQLIGNASVPLIMISIGGFVLVHYRKKAKINYPFVIKSVIFKLFVVPAVFLLGIFIFKPGEAVGFLLILQASMPSATILPLIAKNYGGDHELLSQSMIYNLILTIISFPLFMSIYKALLQ